MPDLILYDAATIGELPDRRYANDPGHHCARLFTRVVLEGVEAFVENAVGTRMEVVVLDDLCIPIVINDGGCDDCYFVSPHAHYVRYAREEIRKTMPLEAVTVGFMALLTALGALGKATLFNRHISVNNWLFSTNPPLALTPRQARDLVTDLQGRYPSHAIVFRTVNAWDSSTSQSLEDAGCMLLPNRDVHLWYPDRLAAATRSVRKRIRADRGFLARNYDREPASRAKDFQTAERLYRLLYCNKHSARNARFTAAFFEAVTESGVCELDLFVRDGETLAFSTSFNGPRFLYALFVGYDPTQDARTLRQYRSVVASFMDASRASRRPLFLSTGVASFKKARGSTVVYEFEAVAVGHLSRRRRLPWRLAKAIYDRIMDALDMDLI